MTIVMTSLQNFQMYLPYKQGVNRVGTGQPLQPMHSPTAVTELLSPNLAGTFSPLAVYCSRFVVGLSNYIHTRREWIDLVRETPSEWSLTRQTISGGVVVFRLLKPQIFIRPSSLLRYTVSSKRKWWSAPLPCVAACICLKGKFVLIRSWYMTRWRLEMG